MAWTKKQLSIAILMVITGSINTLTTKWADTIDSVGSDGSKRKFSHPFIQAAAMFLGEVLCLIVFLIRRTQRNEELEVLGRQRFNPLIFLPPALLDMCATSIMYVGLTLTYASSFQMLRGAVIVFTGLLSISFLERQFKKSHWLGILCITIGLVIVGAADFIFVNNTESKGKNSVITGDLLIVIAQIISATQMVYEERFIRNVEPLAAVGWEGVWGLLSICILLVPLSFIPALPFGAQNPRHTIEDPLDAFYQVYNSTLLLLSLCGTVVSIAFFNFAGISVTKELSATTRMVLDSVRTVVIWAVSLGVGWQMFNYLQIIGFLILILGMIVYNQLIKFRWPRRSLDSEQLVPNAEF